MATPASGLSMSIDDPSNASPRSTLGSSLDRVHWPPGPSVTDDGVRPGYHNHYDHRYGHATSSDALQVTSVVSESGFEFNSTELIPVRVANEGAPAIDPSLATMENAMWTSTETEEMGDEDFYEGRMR